MGVTMKAAMHAWLCNLGTDFPVNMVTIDFISHRPQPMKNDSQADAVLRKTVTLLHIKNAPNGAFFGCFEGFSGGLRSKMVRIGRFFNISLDCHFTACATPRWRHP